METLLFIIVFGTQIYLISHIIAARVLRNISFVLENYPESEYPKLYPLGSQRLQNAFKYFRIANNTIIALGIMILCYVTYLSLNNGTNTGIFLPWSATGQWDAAIVVPFFFLQYLPLFILEISEGKNLALMRTLAKKSVKKASLQKRKLTEYLSIYLLLLWPLTFILVEISILFPVFGDTAQAPEYSTAILMVCGNCFFAAMLFLTLYGKKKDPYLDNQDRSSLIKHIGKYLVTVIIAANSMGIIQHLVDVDGIIREGIIASIFMQIMAFLHLNMLKSVKIEKANFDVYKKPAELMN